MKTDKCRNCGDPVMFFDDWIGWIHSARFTLESCTCAAPAQGCAVIRNEDLSPSLSEILKRLRPKQVFLVCLQCYRPQPLVRNRFAGRKCVCCGNNREKRFAPLLIPMGVAYVWVEHRISRGNKVELEIGSSLLP